MYPKSLTSRTLAILWLGACIGVLYFGYEQQDIPDMPVVFAWFMIFLSFPVGLLGAAFVGVAWSAITAQLGLAYHPFCDLVPYWVTLVAVGYIQWFVVAPKLFQKVRHALSGT